MTAGLPKTFASAISIAVIGRPCFGGGFLVGRLFRSKFEYAVEREEPYATSLFIAGLPQIRIPKREVDVCCALFDRRYVCNPVHGG